MSSVDPMIFFSNILLIRQLLCINTYSKEKSTRSGYVYREEKLEDNLEHLQDEPEEHLDLRCAHIVECLLLSDCETLLERARMKEYKNLQTFHHELPKAIQFVYEVKKFSLYFSAQQEDNAEPMGGLKFFIDETKIEMMKGILKELDRVYLIVVVRSSLQNLSDVDLSDTIQKFDFVTDLYLLNLTHEYTSWDCVSCNTVQNFISLEKVRKLRTLKVKHMLITDEFLEKMGSMALESLSFTECVFLTFKDTVQQSEEIEVAFGKSYETICFSQCKRYEEYRSSYALGRMRCIAIKINLNKCTKLRNLTVNMDYYTSVMLSDQILGSLRYLSLGKKNCELLLLSSRCYVARLEYFVINTWDLELAVNVLKEINRNELKHLVLICYEMISIHEICDVSDLFNLEFAALEVLEIGAGYRDLGLNSRFTSGIQMKKLETLRINCWCVDKELMQMITKFEMLKHLEIFICDYADISYELVWKQLPNLKGPIEKLFVSSKLTVSELIRSIEPLNKLKEFYMDSRSIQSSFDSLANQNYGIFKSAKIYLSRLEEFVINSRFIWSSFYSLVNRNDDKFQPAKVDANKWNLVESKNVVHLKLHTLHIGMGLAQKELIQLMLCQYFEAFAGIKKLVIACIQAVHNILMTYANSMNDAVNLNTMDCVSCTLSTPLLQKICWFVKRFKTACVEIAALSC